MTSETSPRVHEDRRGDSAEPVVRPTEQDEVAAAGSELIGGPLGRWARPGSPLAHPGQDRGARRDRHVRPGDGPEGCPATTGPGSGAPIRSTRTPATRTSRTCTRSRGFADNLVPYFDRLNGDMNYLEYPVLTGLFMEVASWLTPGSGDMQHREQMYWMVNAGMLMVCTAVIAVCVARTHRRRPWDALLVALAPAFALTATINWDLFAVALTAVGHADVVARPSARLRHPDRPGDGREALPRTAPRPAARAVLAGRQMAGVRGGGAGGRRCLAGREPAGDDARARGVEEVLHLQPGAVRRLRIVLADHFAAHGQGPGHRHGEHAGRCS